MLETKLSKLKLTHQWYHCLRTFTNKISKLSIFRLFIKNNFNIFTLKIFHFYFCNRKTYFFKRNDDLLYKNPLTVITNRIYVVFVMNFPEYFKFYHEVNYRNDVFS
jgi:hypothetical protein